MLKKVLIIANPVAGKAQGESYAEMLKNELTITHHSQCDIKITQETLDGMNWAKESVNEDYDTVMCLGGDGTVSEVIKGLMQIDKEKRPYFSFIPLGTVNDLARAIGISLNPDRAVRELSTVSITPLDVGRVNDDYFCNVIALGIIPEEVMNTESSDKNKLGVFAYIKDGIQAFFSNKGYKIQLTSSDGLSEQFETNLIVISLTNSVGGIEFMFSQATYNDGLLHLAAVNGRNPLSTINAVLELSLDNLTNADLEDMLAFSSTDFQLHSIDNIDIATNMDGDPGPELPIDVEVLPGAINLIVPSTVFKQ